MIILSDQRFYEIYKDFVDLTDIIEFKNSFVVNHHLLGYLYNTFFTDSIKPILITAAKNKTLLLDTTQDPVDLEKNIFPICEALDLKKTVTILVNDDTEPLKYSDWNIKWFPRFFIKFRLRKDNKDKNNLLNWDTRQHQMSCYNRSAKAHRFYNFYRMGVYRWADQVHKSFANIEKDLPNEIMDHSELIKPLGMLVYNSCKNIPSHSDDENYEWSNNCHSFLAPGYNNSFANLITESSVYNFCPTEKTVKPLIAGNIIFSISNPGFMKQIEKMGFDLLYDSLDHSRYDYEPDFQARVNKCLAFIDEIFYNLHLIWQDNKTRLKYNNTYFWSDKFLQTITHQVKDIIEIKYY